MVLFAFLIITKYWQRHTREWNFPLLLMRFENGSTTLENCLVVSYKVKHIPTLWPRNFFPKYLSKRNQKIHPQKDLYKNFHGNFIHTSTKLETTQTISINGEMGKEIEVLQLKKMNALLIQATTQINLKNSILNKRSQTQQHHSIYTKNQE